MSRDGPPAGGAAAGPGLSAEDLNYLDQFARTRAGFRLEGLPTDRVEARLTGLAWRDHRASAGAVVAALREDPEGPLHGEVLETLADPETLFFRDHRPFQALQRTVCPLLMERRAAERRLDFWCAAAGTGQEAYSLAMVLNEVLGEAPAWRLRVWASDLRAEALARAEEGRYTLMEVNRGLPAARLLAHFDKRGDDWWVKDDIRRLLSFQRINLLDAWPERPAMDLILARHLLGGFEPSARRNVLERLRRSLRPDGFLLLDPAADAEAAPAGFEPWESGGVVFHRPPGARP